MEHTPTNGRRRFLSGAISAATALGASMALPHVASARTSQTEPHELDKWIDELHGEYRIVLDSVSPKGASEIGGYASTYLAVNQGAYRFTPAQSSVIVIVRNIAAAFGFSDEMWSTYALGEIVSFDDPRTKSRALRNVARNEMAGLHAQGAVIAVCGMATQFLTSQISRTRGADPAEVRKALEANLLPGARIVPSGITTVDRCQRARFSYAYVG